MLNALLNTIHVAPTTHGPSSSAQFLTYVASTGAVDEKFKIRSKAKA